MARIRKCRKVCYFPRTLRFTPVGSQKKDAVVLSVDEYEAIRLIDKEGLSQEQCGERMEVSRTTVQLIYAAARKKLADALVDGLALQIEGGNFQLCDGGSDCHSCHGCFKYRINQQYQKPKGDAVMRIAVTYEDGQVFQHFGHTNQFKVYDTEDGRVVYSKVVDTNGQGHGALAGILTALNVDALICGGIGQGAQTALAAAGVKLYGGVSGEADAAVEKLISGRLEFDPEVRCDHHGHGEDGHACGRHGHENGGCEEHHGCRGH